MGESWACPWTGIIVAEKLLLVVESRRDVMGATAGDSCDSRCHTTTARQAKAPVRTKGVSSRRHGDVAVTGCRRVLDDDDGCSIMVVFVL